MIHSHTVPRIKYTMCTPSSAYGMQKYVITEPHPYKKLYVNNEHAQSRPNTFDDHYHTYTCSFLKLCLKMAQQLFSWSLSSASVTIT